MLAVHFPGGEPVMGDTGAISVMKKSLAFCVVAAMPSVAAAAEPDFSAVEITTIPLSRGVSMLVGQGGNIAVSTGGDGPVIVDDQFAPLVPKITAAVKALQDAPIRFVINTHHHFDHTGGNEALGSAGALIFAHENVRARLSTDQFSKLMNRTVPASPAAALPVVTFDDGVTLHWNDEIIRVEHVAPAHTDGDSHVWFEKANVVHMGDTFVNGSYAFPDVESGGTVAGLIASAEGVLARVNDSTKIIPGHGPLGSKADLQRFHDMLVDVKGRIQKGISSGATLESFIAARPLADLDPEWGDGFMTADRVITLMWHDLAAE
jgi:glyoxylase-like metal-dependent hydrolase (beta-lactamase superfamily II)